MAVRYDRPPEADNACQICSYSLSSLTAFNVLRQLLEGLITEFDRSESDPRVALRLRWVQLSQSDDGLAVALLIERDGGAKYAGIVVFMRMGATHFLMKTLPKVATEMALCVLTYNLTRVLNIVGVENLMEAIKA
jgi:hypothetical protein